MEFFKIPKGGSAIVRFLHTSMDTMPIIKVHTVPTKTASGTINTVVKCNNKDGHVCPLCEKYTKQEYQRVATLYDYTDGQVKCFKTGSRTLFGSFEDACNDWGKKPNEMVFKLGREDTEFGAYTISVMPEKSYPMPEGPDVELDKDSTYMFGLYRSDNEMQEYLKTGTMPKHQKLEGGNREDSWAKQYNSAPKVSVSTVEPRIEPVVVSNKFTGYNDMANMPFTTNVNPQTTIDTTAKTTVTKIEPKVDTTTTSDTFTFENDDFVLPF